MNARMAGPPGGLKVLITGGSRGIGRVIARRLAEKGASLILVGRHSVSLEEARLEIAAISRGQVETVALDIADANVETAIAPAAMALGGINALVNNAGANEPMKLFRDLEAREFRHIVELNLLAHVAITRAVLPHMQRLGGGSIVNIASMAGKIGVPGWSAYCAAKHGMLGFTKTIARELAPDGIRVNAVCPGFVRTEMTSDNRLSEWAEALGMSRRQLVADFIYKQAPLQKFVDADSVAAAVAFLLSEDAHDITGQSLNVSAGIGDY